jgi:beta-mannosidase
MLTSYFSKLLLLVASLPLCTAQHVIDLSGTGWTVTNSAGNVSVPGSLPSQAHLDLFAAGVISEWSQLHDS